MQRPNKIKTLNDLRRRKYYLRKQIKLRGRILDLRIKRFERKLTIPNLTREMFRGSKLELVAPVIASFIADKTKTTKGIFTAISGFLAGIGSIFMLKKRKTSTISTNKQAHQNNNSSYHDQMFI